MVKKKILVNAANLHSGGGVQVAVSFLTELIRFRSKLYDFDISVNLSTKVKSELDLVSNKLDEFFDARVVNIFGWSSQSASDRKLFDGFDLVFTVFGPMYFRCDTKIHLVGFAQSWIVYPDNECWSRFGFLEKIKSRAKYALQWFYFRRATRLVCELEHVRNKLVDFKGWPAELIDVVYNCVSPVFFDRSLWEFVDLGPRDHCFRVGFVGRDYAHKNIGILASVHDIARQVYGIDIKFYVTLSSDEWARRDQKFKSACVNVGVISLAQCPYFYEQVDGVIFPSLLESFSATPLEAMAMGKPLFASDRGFVKDCCLDYPYYFDPLDPNSVAGVVCDFVKSLSSNLEAVQLNLAKAREHSLRFSSSEGRFNGYINIMRRSLGEG